MEGAVVAVGEHEQLQRLRFDHPLVGDIVDDEMGEIGLPGDGAEGGELGDGEADQVVEIRMWVGHPVEHGTGGIGRNLGGTAEDGGFHYLAPSVGPGR